MKNSDIVNHFVITGYVRPTVYNTINKIASANPEKIRKQPADQVVGPPIEEKLRQTGQ